MSGNPSASEAPAGARDDYDEIWREVYGDMQEIGPAHRHMRRIVGRILDSIDYRSVVEVGCGAGQNLDLITRGRSLERLAGVDISQEAIDRAAKRWDGEFQLLDIERGALSESVDLVFSSLVLEHLADDEAALRNMRQMCGRWLLVTTVAGDYDRHLAWERQVGHVRNYGVGELERKLERAGFEPVRVTYWGFPFYSPIARRFQNGMTSEPSYDLKTRALAKAMYLLYFGNSSRRGDLLIALAKPV